MNGLRIVSGVITWRPSDRCAPPAVAATAAAAITSVAGNAKRRPTFERRMLKCPPLSWAESESRGKALPCGADCDHNAAGAAGRSELDCRCGASGMDRVDGGGGTRRRPGSSRRLTPDHRGTALWWTRRRGELPVTGPRRHRRALVDEGRRGRRRRHGQAADASAVWATYRRRDRRIPSSLRAGSADDREQVGAREREAAVEDLGLGDDRDGRAARRPRGHV